MRATTLAIAVAILISTAPSMALAHIDMRTIYETAEPELANIYMIERKMIKQGDTEDIGSGNKRKFVNDVIETIR